MKIVRKKKPPLDLRRRQRKLLSQDTSAGTRSYHNANQPKEVVMIIIMIKQRVVQIRQPKQK